MHSYKKVIYILSANLCSFLLLIAGSTQAAPKSSLIPFWSSHNESNTATIDHSEWQNLLDRFLFSNHSSGINRFNYAKVDKADKKRLRKYLDYLQALDPREYSRAEQKSYWINLYNALTVKLILDNYPVESITDLGKGFFSFGPWNNDVAKIQGQTLTLNNIEHGILRPIWNDNRIHYAVNCASLSCPNLSATAYTATNTEQVLNAGAKNYVNRHGGVHFKNGNLIVSSIYHWYKVDFGGSNESLLAHLRRYAEQDLKQKLTNFKGDIDHEYDWKLNQP